MWILCSRIVATIFLVVSAAAQVSPTTSQELLKRAEAGDPQAQFELGRTYEEGQGVPQDDALAAEWFRKAAEHGNAQAQNSLGVLYAQGRGVRHDKEEAVRWYKKAAKQGLPEATYNVAIAYYNGEGVAGDMVAAYVWMMVALDKGDAQAGEALQHIGEQLHNRLDHSRFELAELYEKGEEVPQNLTSAAALYRELAWHSYEESAFSSPARDKLCELYFSGRGVPQDYVQARSWCKKSGARSSYLILGRLAEQGLGQKKNLREAAGYFKKAALAGTEEAYLETGRVKLEMGSHQEQKNAYFWFYLATDHKIPGADAKLQETAALLDRKEISELQKQADILKTGKPDERERILKKH
jgi:TPR repeat protein